MRLLAILSTILFALTFTCSSNAQDEALPAGAAARLGSYRFFQDSPIGALAFSPDGKVLASASGAANLYVGRNIGTWKSGRGLRLWNPTTGVELPRLDPNAQEQVLDLAYSAEGQWLATVSALRVRIWNFKTGELAHDLELPQLDNPTGQIAFSPDGKWLHASRVNFYRTQMDAYRWNVASGKQVQSWSETVEEDQEKKAKLDEIPVLLAIAPDGKWLLKGFRKPPAPDPNGPSYSDWSEKTKLRFYDAETGQMKVELADINVKVSRLAFSPDGKRYAFGGTQSCLGIVGANTPPHSFGYSIDALVFSRDSARLATVGGHGSGMTIRDATTGKAILQLKHGGDPQHLAFSPDGRALASAEADWIRLWDAETGAERLPPQGHAGPVKQIMVPRDGRTLTSLSTDSLWRWQVATGKSIGAEDAHAPRILQGKWFEVLARSPDGRFQVARYHDGHIGLRETNADATTRRKLDCGKNDHDHFTADFSDDGRIMRVTEGPYNQRCSTFFSVPGCKRLGVFKSDEKSGANGGGGAVASPDGKHLANWAADGRIHLLTYSGQKVRAFQAPANERRGMDMEQFTPGSLVLSFSPDGRYLLSSYSPGLFGNADEPGGAVCLWDVVAGRELRRFDVRLPSGAPGCVASVAWSADGSMLAVSQFPGADFGGGFELPGITIFEVASGQKRFQFDGHKRSVSSIVFMLDGKTLASGGEDGVVYLWDLVAGAAKKDVPTETLWTALAGADATAAYHAMVALRERPQQIVPFLRERIKPIAPGPQEAIVKCIASLDNSNFAARGKAATDLAAFGESAVPALKKALEIQRTLESRRRIEELLGRVHTAFRFPTGSRLRQLRSLQILDQIGTDDAVALLRALADGDPSAQLTQEARAVIDRRRVTAPPDEPFVADPPEHEPPQQAAAWVPPPIPRVAPVQLPPREWPMPWLLILNFVLLAIFIGQQLLRSIWRK